MLHWGHGEKDLILETAVEMVAIGKIKWENWNIWYKWCVGITMTCYCIGKPYVYGW